uniref:CHK kinase-like domain-containing protein n=1 Tax=Panagrolaimus sp. JU765 TaxID=591449 RepID=A0AC34RP50_9BILA
MAEIIVESVENLSVENKIPKSKLVNGLTKKLENDLFDEWKILQGTFTAGFLIESLRQNDQKFIENHGNRGVKEIKSEDISKGKGFASIVLQCKIKSEDISKGKGFASIVLQCKVFFVDSTSESDYYSTILKIPGTESMTEAFEESFEYNKMEKNDKDAIYKKLVEIHDIECSFYEELAPLIDFCVPKVHQTRNWIVGKQQGVIHMDDLSTNTAGWIMFDTMNLVQIKAIVRQLARFHKIILTTDEKLWKGKFLKNQEAYREMGPMVNVTIPKFLEMVKDDPYFEPLINKYLKFGANGDFFVYAFSESWKDLGMKPVIVHGDMWTGNILWKTDKYGEPTNEIVAFVDWQVFHEGSAMADLARILTICCDGYIRRMAESEIIPFYLNELENEMKKDGLECPFTLEQIQDAYDYMFLTQSFPLFIGAIFIKEVLTKNLEPSIGKAKNELIIFRCKQVLEDVDRILSGKYQKVFEKYGL